MTEEQTLPEWLMRFERKFFKLDQHIGKEFIDGTPQQVKEFIASELLLERRKVLQEVREKVIGKDEEEKVWLERADSEEHFEMLTARNKLTYIKDRNKLRAEQRDLLQSLEGETNED